MKTTEEKNRMIAEFMDVKFRKFKGGKVMALHTFDEIGACWEKNLKFHTSWDWLMPVVKKCRTHLFSPRNATEVYMLRDLEDAVLTFEVEEAFEEVINVIEWYNEKL